MTTIRFIGDAHGLFKQYLGIITKSEFPTIQVGDMGIGFPRNKDGEDVIRNVLKRADGKHRFIRGNHDNPDVVKEFPGYIPDATVEEIDGVKLFFMGGAWSIDWRMRTPGQTWWHDEELSYSELQSAIDLYARSQPDILVTHDCSHWEIDKMFKPDKKFSTITQNALEHMYRIWTPKLHIFGHWHQSAWLSSPLDPPTSTTVSVCLDELETFDVNLEEYRIGEPRE